VDGLDVTSGIRQGVLNLTPQPDSIQETSVQEQDRNENDASLSDGAYC
jgi:hypothetical protein